MGEAREEEKEMLMQGLYGLWLARNHTRDGTSRADPTVVAELVYQHITEWATIHERQ